MPHVTLSARRVFNNFFASSMTVADQAFQGVMHFLDQPSVKRQLQQYWSHPLVQQAIQQLGPGLAKLGAGHPAVAKSLFKMFTRSKKGMSPQIDNGAQHFNMPRANGPPINMLRANGPTINRPRNNRPPINTPKINGPTNRTNGLRNSSKVL